MSNAFEISLNEKSNGYFSVHKNYNTLDQTFTSYFHSPGRRGLIA